MFGFLLFCFVVLCFCCFGIYFLAPLRPESRSLLFVLLVFYFMDVIFVLVLLVFCFLFLFFCYFCLFLSDRRAAGRRRQVPPAVLRGGPERPAVAGAVRLSVYIRGYTRKTIKTMKNRTHKKKTRKHKITTRIN